MSKNSTASLPAPGNDVLIKGDEPYIHKIVSRGKEHAIIVDPEFAFWVQMKQWHLDNHGYARRHVSKEEARWTPTKPAAYLHHILLLAKAGHVRQHINGNKLDNRLTNLRYVSRSDHGRMNAKSIPNTLGIQGIRYHTKNRKYIATARILGTKHHIGCYDTPQEAQEARRSFLSDWVRSTQGPAA